MTFNAFEKNFIVLLLDEMILFCLIKILHLNVNSVKGTSRLKNKKNGDFGGGGWVWLATIKKARRCYSIERTVKNSTVPTSSITSTKKWTVGMHIYKFLCFMQVITYSQN